MYDPARNAFDPTANQLADTPGDVTVVALRDGRALVFGNGSSSIFDPASRTFGATTSMVADRVLHTTTLLKDGRVLVTGGSGPGGGPMLASAEVFDPTTGSWSEVGALDVPRQQHAATLLADGRVLITGGTTDDDAGWPLKTAELFDPASATFAPAGAMIGGRAAHTATTLADGRVLIAGGVPDDDPAASQASAELYDPTTGRFAPTASLVTGRYEHAAAALADGRVLVAGGSNDHGNPLTAEIYDPATGMFTVAASATEPHVGPAVRLADGRVLVAGGHLEIFDPAGSTPVAVPAPRADRTFTETGTPGRMRTDHTAIRLRDGRVLVIGGHGDGDGETNTTAELFDPKTGTFSPTGSMSVPRGQASDPPERSRAILLDDGRVLVTGGTRYEWDIEVYDPSTGRFTKGGAIAKEGGIIKRPVTAVRVADGRILAFGPPAAVAGDAQEWGSTGIYQIDPLAGVATLTNEIDGCDAVSQAVPVDDGRVLVICNGPRSWLEIVDVDTGRASVLDGILSGNAGPLLRLPDGRVAFSAGGAARLSVVDPATGLVDQTSALISPAGMPELTLLADGRVLVTGGPDAGLWDPATDAWTVLPAPLADARRPHGNAPRRRPRPDRRRDDHATGHRHATASRGRAVRPGGPVNKNGFAIRAAFR